MWRAPADASSTNTARFRSAGTVQWHRNAFIFVASTVGGGCRRRFTTGKQLWIRSWGASAPFIGFSGTGSHTPRQGGERAALAARIKGVCIVIPRWVLGAIAAGGLVTGCTLAAGAQGVHAPATPTAGSSEVERLYHDEVALSRHETQLQILLGYARAVLKAQAPVPTSVIAGPVTTTPTPASAGASARP